MFYWIYDLPAFWVITLFEAAFVGVFWLGALFLRPFVRAWLHEEARLNDMLAAILQYFGVIFGLLLGLLAVATYQNRLDVAKSNADEASSLSALYRNLSAYPEPNRGELQNVLKDHTRYLIEVSSARASFPWRNLIELPCSKPGSQFSNQGAKRKNFCTRTRYGSSIPSTNVEERGFTA
jgi:hypothetical protein